MTGRYPAACNRNSPDSPALQREEEGTREREGKGHSRRFGADHAGTRREEGREGRKPPREAAMVAGFGSLVARDEQGLQAAVS